MSRKRWVIEGTWSGYTGSQRHVCHRVVTTNPDKFDVTCIGFSDNTTMLITKRECKPRERVTEKHGYDRLLEECAIKGLSGYVNVSQL